METMVLIGTERVQNAGHAMQEAAREMRHAASEIEAALLRQQQFLDEWLSRLEVVLAEPKAPPDPCPACHRPTRWTANTADFEMCPTCGQAFPRVFAEPKAQRPTQWEALPLRSVEQMTIHTGCETETNRQAEMEMCRRGYQFDAREARWVRAEPKAGQK